MRHQCPGLPLPSPIHDKELPHEQSKAGLVIAACLWLGTAAPLHAQDSVPVDGRSAFLFPPYGLNISSVDRIFVIYDQICRNPEIDPTRPAEVHRDGNDVTVDIFLVENNNAVCFFATMPPYPYYVEIGQLPKGDYRVTRRLQVRAEDGSEFNLQYENTRTLVIGDSPHPAISGAWYDPANPGTGLFIGVLPENPDDFSGDVPETGAPPRVVVYLADTDANGDAQWYVGVGRFEDAELAVEMSAGGNSDEAFTLTFTYQGCGQAAIARAETPTEVTPLVQLSTVATVPSCLPIELATQP